MTKKIKVITIQQNQILEIPNDNIDIEPQEIQETPVDTTENQETPVDATENQELHLDIVETVELQDVKPDLVEAVIKVKKPRVKKEKVTPAKILEEQDDIDITRAIEVSDVLNVKPELTQREIKVMHLVKM